ncbi:MAG: hypothetical protein HY611_10515 [Elusimicrobia bacterium]|nr:hypothetical protein [Elusimicrobiota bacterium]
MSSSLAWLKLFFGFIFLLLGLGYCYRPDLVERVNLFIRDYLLNDSYLALERKKWGLLLVLIGLICIYMGVSAMSR